MTKTKKKTAKPILAWHWLSDTGKLRDGSDQPPDGKWLVHRGSLEMCKSGLHASVKALDSLQYAPGPIVCRVECGGRIVNGDDKLVCARRRILWRADATVTLRAFARRCALDVLHLWTAPPIVRQYLGTGDESLRAAAWDAARDAAWAAAGDAAGDAKESNLTTMLLALEPKP